jgi:perosamine synthetase
MDAMMSLAKKHNLKVIEDCAEALGTRINGEPVGSFGDAAAFSFFGNKTITTGEGGALAFRDEEAYQRALLLRDHGMAKNKRYWHEVVGYNYRLTNLQAAIGCAQLEQLETFKEIRSRNFALYDQLLMPSGFFESQEAPSGHEVVKWLYTICLKADLKVDRDDLMKKLKRVGVDTRPVFYPMHEMPAFEHAIRPEPLVHSKSVSYRGLSLPSAVTLKESEIQWVCQQLLELLK